MGGQRDGGTEGRVHPHILECGSGAGSRVLDLRH